MSRPGSVTDLLMGVGDALDPIAGGLHPGRGVALVRRDMLAERAGDPGFGGDEDEAVALGQIEFLEGRQQRGRIVGPVGRTMYPMRLMVGGGGEALLLLGAGDGDE